MKFAIEEGTRLNCRAIRLDIGAQNKPAVTLYKKLGFEIAGTTAFSWSFDHIQTFFMKLKRRELDLAYYLTFWSRIVILDDVIPIRNVD